MPAISTALTDSVSDAADFHLSNGAHVGLALPSRLTLVDVDGLTVAIQTWATSDADLAAWLPTAETITPSFEFVQSLRRLSRVGDANTRRRGKPANDVTRPVGAATT